MSPRVTWFVFKLLSAAALLVGVNAVRAQDIGLNPTRPTVANSAAIQNASVLQVEVGYDAYPQSVPGNLQTVDTLITYAALPRLRLDFDWAFFNPQQDGNDVANGVGTTQAGGKVEFWKEDYHRPAPGVAVQYEAEFPSATNAALQNYGQQATLLVNHHYGPNGDLDVIVNGAVVQSGCQAGSHCSYGGQQSIALSFHLQERTRLYAEVFAQNNSQSNTPPGTYVFAGFYHRFGDTFGIDGGLRFGVSDHSASLGTTVGIVFGRQLRKQAISKNDAR